MARPAQPITMTKKIRAVVDRMLGAPSRISARLHQRLQIVKMASDCKLNVEIARELSVDPQRARRWRKRWAQRSEQLEAAEKRVVADREMESIVVEILADEPRSGAPSKFTAEQLIKLIGVACEKPEDSGIPTSHWTAQDLAKEILRRGIFDSISVRHVGRFLKGSGSKTSHEPLLAHVQRQAGGSRSIRRGDT